MAGGRARPPGVPRIDGRPGGAWRMVMQSSDGSQFKVGGVYRELQRPDRVAYTWQWEEGPMAGAATRSGSTPSAPRAFVVSGAP